MEVANAGPLRPPLVYLIAMVSGVLVQLVAPFPFVPEALTLPLGAALVLLAIAMYLAFSLFQLGIAVWLNSAWLLATLAAAAALMNWLVIPREEAYLERKFGARYLEYKASVRRWL